MTLQTIASIAEERPVQPVFAFRPIALVRAVDCFLTKFKGQVLYAVKTNPEQHVVQLVHAHGVTAFDVASYEEMHTIREHAPSAELYFMHPVKSPHAVSEAYFNYSVRHFSLDCLDELNKILCYTKNAKDLCLHLRLAIPNTFSEFNLSEKFGISLHEAPNLLKIIRKVAYKLGITFHVGSQCMHPNAYRIAIRMADKVINESGVEIEYFNVGGGFPSIYPGMIPPALRIYFEAIHTEFSKIACERPYVELLCEPGRALVAESTSVVVNVELRKGNVLYINDGTYGSLFDAGVPHFIFPVHLLRSNRPTDGDLLPFSFYGPTCDSLDYMKGPFYLPNDIKEGDYIEIGQMGAYGRTLSTTFNGFKQKEGVIMVSDDPLMTMYSDDYITHEPLEIIAA
ncbi:type III PLP-dependent enzyme [Coxiella endosymbiont of Amblyomma americanum]|uniref:type III PLP-dependent enzyme n=1 Tax=Coxiella endosymbiont of Amblyomma americanum TaxID=325775 RepID=UPI00057C7A0E|nr:type III PLP-dependent enzyme [Coxiella endosymbiont of Amblyomma americanum]AJC50331.1 ornithine decarboxylase [Coxiella endosymbiont of Amblyomma americanum]AUJ58678.1 ornithine decarboxylase [Coxiella-like endosymbiont of Amblyomma americanum]